MTTATTTRHHPARGDQVGLPSPDRRDGAQHPRSWLPQALHPLGAVQRDAVLLDGLQSRHHRGGGGLAREYWETVAEQFPEWHEVRRRRCPPARFVGTLSTAMASHLRHGQSWQYPAARVARDQSYWRDRVKRISKMDWPGQHTPWEGRALVGGKVSKATTNVTLTTNVLRQQLGPSPDARRSKASKTPTAREGMTTTVQINTPTVRRKRSGRAMS